ncbi:MAG: cupin domain-containing protein [Acidobacteriota bacterium]|nr:cupin domain-containing protein [Acidobacteriota bacterium]
MLPLLAVSGAGAQTSPLPSQTLKYDEIPVKQNGRNRSRAGFKGETHSGCAIEVHQTELAPGEAPHPPHRHVHDEAIFIREGTLEVTIDGRKSTLGPGSIAYAASNVEHGWRNTGTTPANYFVLALGRDNA